MKREPKYNNPRDVYVGVKPNMDSDNRELGHLFAINLGSLDSVVLFLDFNSGKHTVPLPLPVLVFDYFVYSVCHATWKLVT